MEKTLKKEFYFFKSSFIKFKIKDLIPIFKYSKNIQGYVFTRNYTLYYLRYCLLFSVVKYENQKEKLKHE